MIILGIDPGSRITGYGLIKSEGNHSTHVENGSIYLAQDDLPFAERLANLFNEIQGLIKKFKPSVLVVENIFYAKNPKSLQKLGEVRGVILLCGALNGLEVSEFTPLEVKKAVTGYGSASKDQVQKMVRVLLGLKDLAEENASDALAGALCFAQNATHRGIVRRSLKNVERKYSFPTEESEKTLRKDILKKASFYR